MRLHKLALAAAFLLYSTGNSIAASNEPAVPGASFLSGEEAQIRNTAGRSELMLLVTQPERYTDPDGQLLVSVEVPKKSKIGNAAVTALPWSSNLTRTTPKGAAAVELAKYQIVGTNMPPGPNNDTEWLTFSRVLKDFGAFTEGPLLIRAAVNTSLPLTFTRILVGRPSTPRSVMIGAFAPPDAARSTGTLIVPGVDYLGTVTAHQHFRIPANALAPDTAPFDEMVDFGDAPFEPDKNNIDTVMLRTKAIHPGETTPVRLLRFANRSKAPIRIHGKSADLLFNITARLSPNARSGGFITILPDGTYRSTTTLSPVLEFQRVEEGKPVGTPITIDTAIVPIVGFPFYLASDGGRWVSRAPQGRFASAMTSNFFYNNGAQNAFIHSNGPALGVVGKCAKASAQFHAVGSNQSSVADR